MHHALAETLRPPLIAAVKRALATMGGHGRVRATDPRRARPGRRLEAARSSRPARQRVAAHAPGALLEASQRLAEAAAAGAATRARIVTAAAGAVVVARVVVVTQAEEPHEPHDQQADIEDAEADHEDPTLGGHVADGTSTRTSLKA